MSFGCSHLQAKSNNPRNSHDDHKEKWWSGAFINSTQSVSFNKIFYLQHVGEITSSSFELGKWWWYIKYMTVTLTSGQVMLCIQHNTCGAYSSGLRPFSQQNAFATRFKSSLSRRRVQKMSKRSHVSSNTAMSWYIRGEIEVLRWVFNSIQQYGLYSES